MINRDELLKFLHCNGYLIIDSDEIEYSDQIKLFSQASEIIGLHGAGLSNMVFRHSRKTRIIEIFSEDYIGAHYYWLAYEMGFNYNAILSGKLINNGFFIDIEHLEKYI